MFTNGIAPSILPSWLLVLSILAALVGGCDHAKREDVVAQTKAIEAIARQTERLLAARESRGLLDGLFTGVVTCSDCRVTMIELDANTGDVRYEIDVQPPFDSGSTMEIVGVGLHRMRELPDGTTDEVQKDSVLYLRFESPQPYADNAAGQVLAIPNWSSNLGDYCYVELLLKVHDDVTLQTCAKRQVESDYCNEALRSHSYVCPP